MRRNAAIEEVSQQLRRWCLEWTCRRRLRAENEGQKSIPYLLVLLLLVLVARAVQS